MAKSDYQKRADQRLKQNIKIFKKGIHGLFADSATYQKENSEKSEDSKK